MSGADDTRRAFKAARERIAVLSAAILGTNASLDLATVLGEAARNLLDGLAESASGEWVFPGGNGGRPLTNGALCWLWTKARDLAGIVADARLHIRRHADASHAVTDGESLHVAGRLPGLRRASSTDRYVHLDGAALSEAAERLNTREFVESLRLGRPAAETIA